MLYLACYRSSAVILKQVMYLQCFAVIFLHGGDNLIETCQKRKNKTKGSSLFSLTQLYTHQTLFSALFLLFFLYLLSGCSGISYLSSVASSPAPTGGAIDALEWWVSFQYIWEKMSASRGCSATASMSETKPWNTGARSGWDIQNKHMLHKLNNLQIEEDHRLVGFWAAQL